MGTAGVVQGGTSLRLGVLGKLPSLRLRRFRPTAASLISDFECTSIPNPAAFNP